MPFTAGQRITFTATFTLEGSPQVPASATLRVRAKKSGVYTFETYAMALVGDAFVYELDTTGYDAANHAWTIYTDDLQRAVKGGEISTIRNLSNPF